VLVALEFHYRDPVRGFPQHSTRVALFPGAFNPPTIAHLAIARAARQWAGEVVWTLPRAFPHKAFEGAGFDVRLAMLRQLLEGEPGSSVAIASGGLYVEMADEAREFFGAGVEIGLLCGRDAAERIAAWITASRESSKPCSIAIRCWWPAGRERCTCRFRIMRSGLFV